MQKIVPTILEPTLNPTPKTPQIPVQEKKAGG
jgi:hypothetical protein